MYVLTVYVVDADMQVLPEGRQVAMALAGARVFFTRPLQALITGGEKRRGTATQTDAHLRVADAT